MSSLMKTSYFNIDHTDRRVIDTNAIIEKKLEKMRREEEMRAQASFVAGINAEVVEGLLSDESEGAIYGNPDMTPEEIEALNAQMAEGEGDNPEFRSGIVKAPMVDTSAILNQANEQAEAIIADAEARAQAILENAQKDAEGLTGSIIEEARNTGYNDGLAKAQAELDAAQNELRNQINQLNAEYESRLQTIEPELVDIITDVYQHIFDVDLSAQKQILVHLIDTTIHRIEGTKSFLVHVSPEDAPFVAMQKKSLEESAVHPDSLVEIIEDVNLGKNECMIETDGGIFDCSLGVELQELAQKLKILSYNKN